MLERRRQVRAGQELRLAKRDQLVGEGQFERGEDAVEVLGGEQRVRLEVLLPGGSVEGVDGGGRGQRSRLGGDPDHLLVQDDDPGLASGVGRKLVGQLGEACVEQSMQPLLEQVYDLRERGRGGGKHKTKYWAWKLPVE